MATSDVLIAGGGIIGCALAWRLAEQKVSVTVVDRADPGQEASWAAAGMLAPTAEEAEGSPEAALARASAELYPAWVEALEQHSQLSLNYRREGTLLVVFNREEAAHLNGLPGEALTAAEVRRQEPALSEAVVAARFLPGDRQVDNRRLLEALVKAARAAGVRFLAGTPVAEWWLEGGRARGVRTAGGERLEAGAVVNALGAWAGRVPPLGQRFAPVHPVRGQMLALRAAPGFLKHVVRSARGYLVPRGDGRLLLGSTMEEAGFDKSVTPAGLRSLLAAGIEISPGITELAFEEAWAGLRPDTPDHRPILGKTAIENYYVASGHFRNGILLAPITAKLMAEVILGRAPSLPLEPFSPRRFGW